MSDGKVLIVEDDKDLNNIYSLILKRAGYQVSQTYNGQEALDQLDDNDPDVVLLDIFMPVMDGKTFLQQLNNKSHPDMRIIVCSNTSDSDLLEEMLQLGADKVVTKSSLEPSDITDLVAPYFTTQ